MNKPLQIWVIAVLLALASPVVCALETENEQLRRAVSLMQNEQWQLAYSVFSEIDNAEQAAGVSEGLYGKLLFSMGLCQMELAKAGGAELREGSYQKALNDFERCRNFIGSPDDQNPYVRISLLRMGMCYQALRQFDAAYAAYAAFLVERNQISDVYDHGSLLLNLATCSLHRSSPVDAETLSYLQQAVDGRKRFKIATAVLCKVVLDVYGASADRFSPEQELVLLAWLTELTPKLEGDSDVFLEELSNTAQKFSDNGNVKSTQSLLRVLPWLSAQPTAKLDTSGSVGYSSVLVARSIEQYAYAQSAQQRGNLLSQLIEQFPQSARLSEWLYSCTVTHFELDQIYLARADAALYKSKFPNGEYLSAIELLELSSLFDAGQYAEALALLEVDSSGDGEQNEDRLYVMAGSTCFLGEYQRSLSLAAKYFEIYPDGEHAKSVRYFQAVSYARLGYAAQARSILMEIITTLGVVHDYAQYELAMLDFDSSSYLEAQKRLEEMRKSEMVASLRVQADLLLARISAILRERETAEILYLDSLKLAKSSDLLELEQEVMFYLIAFYGREKIAGEPNLNMEKCLPYYDTFFQKYPDSPYAAQVASAAMAALKDAGELDRGIKRLELVLQSACDAAKEAGVRDAASSLIWARIDAGMKPSELKLQFSSHELSRFSLVQWFALIEVYAVGLDQAHTSWGRKLYYDATIRGMYAQLSLQANEVKLPGYIDLALGEWYLMDENFPQLARGHFTEAGSSDLIRQQHLASLGTLKSLRVSATESDLQQARIMITGMLERCGEDEQLLEKVMYESIEVLSNLQSWDILTDEAKEYLSKNKFAYRRSRVWYLLAKSYDLRGINEDAMANYSRVFAGFTRVLAVSAPSVERLSEITWQRNRPEMNGEKADRQIAYQLAHRYLTMVKDYPEWEKKRDGVRQSLVIIRANVDAWEASGEVISVEQMLREMRQGKR
ncbi:MAG: tetratricopeptide (TPR) repeat protein [Crocinitomicaceae bacterium]|jgi:tetratricopeptide (TPR) repeat protein